MLTQRDVEDLDALLLPLELYLPELGMNIDFAEAMNASTLDARAEVTSVSSASDASTPVVPQRRKCTSCKTRIEQLREEVVRLKVDLHGARQVAADRVAEN